MTTSSDEDELVPSDVCSTGDLLLEAKDDAGVIKGLYRVDSIQLTRCSGYYKTLFKSDFGDGLSFREGKARLSAKYGSDGICASPFELPRASLPYPVGCTREKAILKSLKLFLIIVHQHDRSATEDGSENSLLLQVSNDIDLFAHVVALADQLDASSVFQYMAEQILNVQPIGIKSSITMHSSSERYWRQCLYIAYTCRLTEAFRYISGKMIWRGFSSDITLEPEAPWTVLPNGIEEEMVIRREAIFNTIASVPNALLKPYMTIDKSKRPICKLGWSNSPACDSFQLGESIRWLCRRKLANPTIAMVFAVPDDEPRPPQGSPKAVLKTLREFSDYQIDVNHFRCGIKGKLILILNAIEKLLLEVRQIGICLECWRSQGSNLSSWSMDHCPSLETYKGNIRMDVADMQKRIKAREAAQLSVIKAKHQRVTQSKASTNSTCKFAYEHDLYARVFSHGNWTEKEWFLEQVSAERGQ